MKSPQAPARLSRGAASELSEGRALRVHHARALPSGTFPPGALDTDWGCAPVCFSVGRGGVERLLRAHSLIPGSRGCVLEHAPQRLPVAVAVSEPAHSLARGRGRD